MVSCSSSTGGPRTAHRGGGTLCRDVLILGHLRGILFVRELTVEGQNEGRGIDAEVLIAEESERNKVNRKSVRYPLAKIGDFFIEVGQGGFERFSMIGVGCRCQIVDDAHAGHLKILDALLP